MSVAMKPLAFARRWHAAGEVPFKERNENGRMAYPRRFILRSVTEKKVLDHDVPLYAIDADELKALIDAAMVFDTLYQPDGQISHWDLEEDRKPIFGVNNATITLGDMRKLRAALAAFK